jgi:hypothetical protein
MYTYYEVQAVNKEDNEAEVLFGSYDKQDCLSELDAEREYWRQDYKKITMISRQVNEAPDPEVYSDFIGV